MPGIHELIGGPPEFRDPMNYYIGADGRSYDSFQSLQDANRTYGESQRVSVRRERF